MTNNKNQNTSNNNKNNDTTNFNLPALNPIHSIFNLHLTDLLRVALLYLKNVSGIYCIKCSVTGAMYIGSAVDLSKRLAEHLLYTKSNEHLQNAIAKYGLELFTIQITLAYWIIGCFRDK
jgi:hypothetical protein